MQAAKAAQAQNGMARRLGSTEAILSISTESRAYHSTSAQARVGIAVGKEGNAYFPIIGRSMFIDIGCFFALHVCSTHTKREFWLASMNPSSTALDWTTRASARASRQATLDWTSFETRL